MGNLYCPSCDYPPESEQDLALHLADEHGLSQLQAESRAKHVAMETGQDKAVGAKPKEAPPMTQGVKGTATECGYCKRPVSQPHSEGCRIAKAQGLPRGPLEAKKAGAPRKATRTIAAPPKTRRESSPARTAATNGLPSDALALKLAELRAQVKVLEELCAELGAT